MNKLVMGLGRTILQATIFGLSLFLMAKSFGYLAQDQNFYGFFGAAFSFVFFRAAMNKLEGVK